MCPSLLHFSITAHGCAMGQLILSAKSPIYRAAATVSFRNDTRVLTGNNDDLPIADRL
jgi:hypothetical protein